MSIHEITNIEEDEDMNSNYLINNEAEKDKVRKIIKYQKSLYSSSSSLLSSSSLSHLSLRTTTSLMELMKEGSSSLGRLFEMEHTSLATLFKDYSGSPLIRPILLWGSTSSGSNHYGLHGYDPWNFNNSIINPFPSNASPIGSCDHEFGYGKSNLLLTSFGNKDSGFGSNRRHPRRRRLRRKRSFRRLPRIWNWRMFRFGFRVRRLKVFICCRKF